VKQAENVFKLLPELREFDHYTPSAWLLRHSETFEGTDEKVLKTLDRAEAIFKAFNSLLAP